MLPEKNFSKACYLELRLILFIFFFLIFFYLFFIFFFFFLSVDTITLKGATNPNQIFAHDF